MCIGLGSIASIASVAGTGLSAIGAITQGNAAAQAASYQAQVAANNQITANQNAAYATAAGEARATDQAIKERQRAGAITATMAAQGVDINTGSASDARASQAELGQLDVEQVRHKAALQNYGYRTQATGFGAESALDKAQVGPDRSAGYLKGFGSILGAAPQLPKLFGSSLSDDNLGFSDFAA